MKRGFTLLELQITLLLTTIVMSMLFLFTFYFKKNHFTYAAHYRVDREVSTFFDWLAHASRNSSAIEREGEALHFQRLEGRRDVLVLGEDGPVLDGQPFFTEPVTLEAELLTRDGYFQWHVVVREGKRHFNFKRTFSITARASLGDALRASAREEEAWN